MATQDPYSRGTPTSTTPSSPTGSTAHGGTTGSMPGQGSYGSSGTPGGTTSAGTMVENPREAVGQAADQAQQKVAQVADMAQQQAKARLGGQLEQASQSLGSVADAMSTVGQQLRQKDQPQLAGLADQASERIEHFSNYLNGRDVDELVGDVERFARRQPLVFVGGAFFLGLLAARFLKSTPPRDEMDYRYDADYGGRSRYYGDYGNGPYDRPRADYYGERRRGYQASPGSAASQYRTGYANGGAGTALSSSAMQRMGDRPSPGTSTTPSSAGTTSDPSRGFGDPPAGGMGSSSAMPSAPQTAARPPQPSAPSTASTSSSQPGSPGWGAGSSTGTPSGRTSTPPTGSPSSTPGTSRPEERR